MSRSSSRSSLRITALALAVALLVSTGPGAAARSTPDTLPSPSVPTASDTDPVGALAETLDFDTDRIFRFVADDVRYEPYAGILRGARGTLAARAGNSLDKSLLLAALLDASLVRYRFARGPLDPTTAARILGSTVMDAATARAATAAALMRDPARPGDTATSPAPSASPPASIDLAQVRADALTQVAEAGTRLDGTVAMLETALHDAGVSLPTDDPSLPPSEIADHTWVQIQFGTTWRDLDPTLPGAEPGSVLTSTAETLAELPDDLRYRVGIEVDIERVAGGQLATDTVLDYSGFADELAGVPVTFGHVTPSGVRSLGVKLGNLLGDGWLDYRPTLDLGSQALVADESVAFPTGSAAGPLGGTDPFSDAASPGAGAVDGEATAEWFQVTVTGPGTAPMVARRTVFDRVPADMRRTGAIELDAIEPIELVDVQGTGTAVYPPMAATRTIVVATGPTSALSVAADVAHPSGMFGLAYHMLRDALDAGAVLDEGARTFIDAPNIVSVTVAPEAGPPAPQVRAGLDILTRHQGVLPLAGASTTSAKARLEAGVMAHIAERAALEGMGDAPTAFHRGIGVSEVFEAASDAHIPTLVLHGSIPDQLPFGPVANAHVQEAVAAGQVVVVPAEPVMLGGQRTGWWAIDPTTGAVVDAMDDLSGAEMEEYGYMIEVEQGEVWCFGAMAEGAVIEIAFIATTVLFLGQSPNWIYWNEGLDPSGTRCILI